MVMNRDHPNHRHQSPNAGWDDADGERDVSGISHMRREADRRFEARMSAQTGRSIGNSLHWRVPVWPACQRAAPGKRRNYHECIYLTKENQR